MGPQPVLTRILVALAALAAIWLGVEVAPSGNAPSAPVPIAMAPGVAPESGPDVGAAVGARPSAAPSPPGHPAVPSGAFDYYVLALSWSPSFCEGADPKRDRMQCGGRPFAFIVHGLWPQNETGYPEDCPTDAPRVPDALVDEMLDLMPSRGLIGHEWRAHGACTGFSQEDFFATLRKAYEAVTIPARFQSVDQPMNLGPSDIAREFLKANEGRLTPDAIVVTCGRGQDLEEVRLCMDKKLHFRSCGQQTSHAACRRDSVTMPPEHGE